MTTRLAPVISATPFVWTEPRLIPPRRFVYGHHYARKFVSETIANPGLGKSSLGMVEAIAIVTRRALLGVIPEEQTNVWYWNGEDPMDELQRRFTAIMLHFDVDPTEVRDRLFLDSGRDTKIVIAEQMRSGAVVNRPVVEAVIATITENKIGVAIIDPFVASHRVVENDNPAIEVVASAWSEITDRTDSAIDLIHHARKTGGAEVTVEDGRGGGALLAKVRSARVLNAMSEQDAEKAGVENRRAYFRVETGKASMSRQGEQAAWFKFYSVELGNGDSVGVITKWKWPDPLAEISVADLRNAQSSVAKGKWRANSQAKDWVGKPIAKALGLDIAEKATKAKIKSLLKIWIANGMFVEVEGKDEQREIRSFVEVGTWADDN